MRKENIMPKPVEKQHKESDFEGITIAKPKLLYETPKDLDKKDIELLKLLDENARYPISKLSRKLGMARDTIKYRMQKLIKSRIILKFTAVVNPPNFGFTNIAWVFLSLWNVTEEKEEEFVKHLKNNPYVTYFAKVGGRWDYKIEITARNPGHFDEILTGIRRKFPDIIRDYESIPLLKEYKMAYFPYGEVFIY